MNEQLVTIAFILLLIPATRGIFALYNDLSKVVWIDRRKGDWNLFEGYSERDQVEETLDRR